MICCSVEAGSSAYAEIHASEYSFAHRARWGVVWAKDWQDLHTRSYTGYVNRIEYINLLVKELHYLR